MNLQQQRPGMRHGLGHGPRLAVALAALSAALVGCGGGGGGGTPPPTQVTSFALRAGVITYRSEASASQFVVTGSCTGTGTRTLGAPTLATFEGVSSQAQTMTTSMVFSDCTPASSASSVTLYSDAQFSPLGWVSPGVDYGLNDATPVALPASTQVGDTAVQAVQLLYTDSTKKTSAGQRVLSYAVEPDTASSVIVNFIERLYDAEQALVFTEQQRLRLDDLGTMTMVSVDQQYTDEAKTHLLLTAR